ncbi:MAG: NnrU family protein [Rhodoferax sp.]|nr:NnrU family protein [Rhodoferax sp.]
MAALIVGLLVFLGVHSLRIFASDWRIQARARFGAGVFKGVYALVSLVGLLLIVWGFGLARELPTLLWLPPAGLRHVAALLNVLAFVLLAAAYVPGNSIKARLHHPMLLGIKTWALAHLLANGNLAHVLLFGSFLVWSVLAFVSCRRRDRALQTFYPPGTAAATGLTVALGVLAAGVFALWLHGLLIGVKPFG